jgi:hypothetical protein
VLPAVNVVVLVVQVSVTPGVTVSAGGVVLLVMVIVAVLVQPFVLSTAVTV